ncbi:hypothetical protein BGZ82_000306 [Podila clonocystis]|nr:hypothetical protein BGZ82_000306 [Podila clonocystis]
MSRLGLSTNFKVIRALEKEVMLPDVGTMVQAYLAHPEVACKYPSRTHFDPALKVFAQLQFTLQDPSAHQQEVNQDGSLKPPHLENVLLRLADLRLKLNTREVSTTQQKPKTEHKKPLRSVESMTKKELVSELQWEHPTRTLDIGTVNANVSRVLTKEVGALLPCDYLPRIKACLLDIARLAARSKRICQLAIGQYLEQLPLQDVDEADKTILRSLCPPYTNKDIAIVEDDTTQNSSDPEEPEEPEENVDYDDGNDNKNASLLFFMSLLTAIHSSKIPSRGGKSGLAIGLLKKKGFLPSNVMDRIDPNLTPVENFIILNGASGGRRRLTPMSTFDSKFVTVSELELTKIFWQDEKLKIQLQHFAHPDFPSIDSPEKVAQLDVALWIGRVEPGYLINKLLTDIGGYSVEQRKKGYIVEEKRKLQSYSKSTLRMSIEKLKEHVHIFRQDDFNPTSYTTRGYVLRGSVRTDGFWLQLLGFKLNELNCVKYRRLPAERLPPRLTSTMGGTDYHLSEIRNVVTSKEDIAMLWNCDPHQIKILGIDLGQAFVVGASAILPSSNQPTATHRQEPGKGKAVYQPTFKHRRWLEQRKGRAIDGRESVARIETGLPPLCGSMANIKDYTKMLQDVGGDLEAFYGNVVLKKHKWNSKKAKDEEYRMVANRLLELVGGSLGAKRDDANKVVIGYIVVGVNEYYTSKRCPICEEFVGQVDIRRLYCSKCKTYMHRDVMAGHNICNAVQGHLLKQQRPRYLQPKDINGHYPWEDSRRSVTIKPNPATTMLRPGGSWPTRVKRKAPGDWTGSDQKRTAK